MKPLYTPFSFHNPLNKKIIDYAKLEELDRRNQAPPFVNVIDKEAKIRLGRIPTSLALEKYKY